jgi:hypothetical protein
MKIHVYLFIYTGLLFIQQELNTIICNSVSNLSKVRSITRNVVTSLLLKHITLQDKFLYHLQTFDSCIFSKISTSWNFLFQPAFRPPSQKQELCYLYQDQFCYLYIILIHSGNRFLVIQRCHWYYSDFIVWIIIIWVWKFTVLTCFPQFYWSSHFPCCMAMANIHEPTVLTFCNTALQLLCEDWAKMLIFFSSLSRMWLLFLPLSSKQPSEGKIQSYLPANQLYQIT